MPTYRLTRILILPQLSYMSVVIHTYLCTYPVTQISYYTKIRTQATYLGVASSLGDEPSTPIKLTAVLIKHVMQLIILALQFSMHTCLPLSVLSSLFCLPSLHTLFNGLISYACLQLACCSNLQSICLVCSIRLSSLLYLPTPPSDLMYTL